MIVAASRKMRETIDWPFEARCLTFDFDVLKYGYVAKRVHF